MASMPSGETNISAVRITTILLLLLLLQWATTTTVNTTQYEERSKSFDILDYSFFHNLFISETYVFYRATDSSDSAADMTSL